MMHNNESANNSDIKERFSENGELLQSVSTGAQNWEGMMKARVESDINLIGKSHEVGHLN